MTDKKDALTQKIIEALRINTKALKAAFADMLTVEKIINSTHKDRMQMEIKKQNLKTMITINEQALAEYEAM